MSLPTHYKRPPVLVFIDLDGVLADYDTLAAQYGFKPHEGAGQQIPGFYLAIKPFPGAVEFVDAVEDLLPGSVRFCTACSVNRPEAWGEKVQWILKHFNKYQDRLTITRDKSSCGTQWDYLVDDQPTWAGASEFPGRVFYFSHDGGAGYEAFLEELKGDLENGF